MAADLRERPLLRLRVAPQLDLDRVPLPPPRDQQIERSAAEAVLALDADLARSAGRREALLKPVARGAVREDLEQDLHRRPTHKACELRLDMREHADLRGPGEAAAQAGTEDGAWCCSGWWLRRVKAVAEEMRGMMIELEERIDHARRTRTDRWARGVGKSVRGGER